MHLDAKPAAELALVYLHLSIWIVLLGIPLGLAVERSTSARRANLTAGICSFLAVIPSTVFVGVLGNSSETDSMPKAYLRYDISCRVQASMAFVAVAALSTLPKGPALYLADRPVDSQYSTSILSRFSFSWFPELFTAAAKETRLDIDDLPVMSRNLRSEIVFNKVPKGKSDILNMTLRRYRYEVFLQVVFGTLSEVLGLGPELFLFLLLRVLENPSKWSKYLNPWTAALCMGVLLALRTFIDVGTYWMAWTWLEMPVEMEVISTVFAKGLRKKNTSGPPTDDEESPRKNKLNVINLISTDSTRCSAAFGRIFEIPRALLKFFLSVIFLTFFVLGWQSVLMSLITFVIVVPLNIWLTKLLVKLQKKARQISDVRLDLCSESLQSARHIKFTGLETLWIERLFKIRRSELQMKWYVKLLSLCHRLLFIFGPVVKDVVAFGTYVYIHGSITPSVAFTSSLVLSRMDAGLFQIPTLTTMKRINDYLNSEEKAESDRSGDSVVFQNATIAWPSDSEATAVLTDVSLNFPKGEFSVITGPTGSGKSLILASILGESELLSGSVTIPPVNPGADWIIPGLTAFVPQTPWTENATIQENILFGLPFDEERYRKVTYGCSLDQDFEALVDGDQTEVGALGVTLSGGQRCRVALARALYSRAAILVLDDVFSAVDAHVGSRILSTLCGDLCRDRTRIMATHHVNKCLGQAAFVVVLRDKAVFKSGPPNEFNLDMLSFQDTDTPEAAMPTKPKKTTQKPTSKLVKEEARAKGHVTRAVYFKYFTATGGILAWTAILIGYGLHRTGQTWSSWWLKLWTESYQASEFHSLWYYMSLYIVINLVTCLVLLLEEVGTLLASIRASRVMFEELVSRVLFATLRWFDTVPVGRILNRLSADMDVIDQSLCHDIGRLFWLSTRVVFVIAIGTLASPLMLIAAGLLFAMCGYFAYAYVPTAREARRVLSNSRSPMFEQFGSALAGLETIRASDRSSAYIQKLFGMLDNYVCINFYMLGLGRWLAFRLGMVGCIYTILVTALIITLPSVDAALVGFVLSYVFRFDQTVRTIIRTYATVELNMNAAERVVEFFSVPTDPQDGLEPPAAWPTRGAVEIENLQIRYAPELPPVLKGVTFSVEGGQRLAVVGRTGAGKSSLALALFRILEAGEGTIRIDGIDISKLCLSTFRQRLTIISQDPVLFSGTVRNNLDPFDQHDDTELALALKSVSTVPDSTSTTTNMPSSLDFEVSEGGNNLSHGQRQLLCLARALISKSKIIVFDEATSAVDMETDVVIQKTIRRHFTDATMICIAHRLSTVIDFDQVLVLGGGKVMEQGSPKELYKRKNDFWRMVQSSGERKELEKVLEL